MLFGKVKRGGRGFGEGEEGEALLAGGGAGGEDGGEERGGDERGGGGGGDGGGWHCWFGVGQMVRMVDGLWS